MSKKSLCKPLYLFLALLLMALVLTTRPARVGASAHRIDLPPGTAGQGELFLSMITEGGISPEVAASIYGLTMG